MTEEECSEVSNCTLPNGILRECYSTAVFSDEENFCDCSPWYGWIGEDCDEISGQNIFYTIFMLFIATWCLFIFIAITRTVYLHFKFGRKLKGSPIDPVLYTAFFIILSSILVFLNCSLNISAALNPKSFELTSYNDLLGNNDQFLTAKGGKFSGFALLIAAGLVALASMQIFASWQNIAVKASNFSSESNQIVAKNTLIGIRVIVIVYLVLLLLFAVTDQIVLSSFILAFLALPLAVCYPIAYFRLKKTFARLQVVGNEYVNKMISLIRFCCKVNAISLVISGISLVVFYILFSDYKSILTPGRFNYVVLFRDLGSISGLFQISVMSWYINSVANRGPMVPTNFLWRSWDSQYVRLLTADTSVVNNKSNQVSSVP